MCIKKEISDVSSTAFPSGADWDTATLTMGWLFFTAFISAAVTKQGTVRPSVRILVAVELLRGFNLDVCFSCKKMEIPCGSKLILITLCSRKKPSRKLML